MYRRRRPQREKIAFGFDSFLDIVANVIGIIIRLILVAWVGARAYTETMKWKDDEAPPEATVIAKIPAPVPKPPLPAPRPEEDPLFEQLALRRREIDEAKTKLLEHLRQLDFAQQKQQQTQQTLAQVADAKKKLEADEQALAQLLAERGAEAKSAALSLAELQERGQKLAAAIQALENLPVKKKTLAYHTPVSRTIQSDEVFFECKDGRVAFIDLPVFLDEIKDELRAKGKELQTQWKVEATTRPAGVFRLRYVVERQQGYIDSVAPIGTPPRNTDYSYGIAGWEVEPLTATRGESLDAALASGSEFRSVVDGLAAQQTVVTFWVYPESFALFRRLRDYLYERDLEVAARPLPPGAPIRASRNGTASRGQ